MSTDSASNAPYEAKIDFDDPADVEKEIHDLHNDGRHDEVRDLALGLLADLTDAYRRIMIGYDRLLNADPSIIAPGDTVRATESTYLDVGATNGTCKVTKVK